MELLIYYILISFMFAGVLNVILDRNLEVETDKYIKELYNNKLIKYLSISLVSMFWIITLNIIIYKNLRSAY